MLEIFKKIAKTTKFIDNSIKKRGLIITLKLSVLFLIKKIKEILSKQKDIKIYFKQIIFKQKIAPTSIYIEPTNICNANCIFCAYQFYNAKRGFMDFETLDSVLKESKSIGIDYINLTPFAGEILTDKNIINKIKLIKSYKFTSIETYSNLLNLHQFNIMEFLNCGLTELHISAAPLDKNLFERIFRVKKYDIFLKNLQNLLKKFNEANTKTIKKISISFRSPITLNECINLPDYKNYIEKHVSENVNVSAMNTFDSWMGVIKETDLIKGMKIAKPNGKKLIPCSRLSNVQVLSNGDMRICGCRFNNKSKKDIFYIGNIKNISIKEAYNSNIVHEIKKSFLKNNPPIECQKCSWYS